MQAQTDGRDRRRRRGPVPDRCARAGSRRSTARSPIWCAGPASPSVLVANKSEGARRGRRRARSLCARSRRSGRDLGRARRGPGRPLRRAARRAAGADRDAEPRRRARPTTSANRPIRVAVVGRPERRQVDADQSAARRGAPADRPGSRHHPRRHRGRLRMARPARSACTTPPACAGARASRRSSKSSRSPSAARDPLRRSRDRADGRASGRSRSRTCASPTWSSARAARSSSA